MNDAEVGLGLLAILAISMTGLGLNLMRNSPLGCGPIAGITVTHNGQPVHDLAVSMSNPGSSTPLMTGTTDGSGTFSYREYCFFSPSTIMWSFTYNGTQYAVLEPNQGIATIEK